MMALLSLIFLAILLASAVVAVWAVWAVPALIVAKRKVRAVLWGLPVSVIVVVCGVASYWWTTSRPDAVFQREFGFAPTADTRVIDASSSALGDVGGAFVHFRTSQAIIDQIVTRGGYVSGAMEMDFGPPGWFSPATGSNVQRYRRELSPLVGTRGNDFFAEFRELTFDPTTGHAWYAFHGVD